jgi:integrase
LFIIILYSIFNLHSICTPDWRKETMKASIINSLIPKIKAAHKQYDIRDTKLTGFLIRVNPTGKMMYVCEYARGKRMSLGRVGILTPIQARDCARKILADHAKGVDPKKSKKKLFNANLREYITHEYRTWVLAQRKRGKETITRLFIHFIPTLGDIKLIDINLLLVEKWRTQRLNAGIKPATVNRDIAALKAALSKAVEWGFIEKHPLAKLKPLKVDIVGKVRYLSDEEEMRLRKTLDDRESEARIKREQGNVWRKERGYPELPDLNLVSFVDYMKPMILLSINTGLRQGELFGLTWAALNFDQAMLSISNTITKNSKTRYVPLNQEALAILDQWKSQQDSLQETDLIFPNPNGKRLNNVKKAWKTILRKAMIENFRWHDMRHHFASRLVMAGVDLNTVRELLGHSDLKMTLRYAHLAPEHKAAAVAKLVRVEKHKVN